MIIKADNNSYFVFDLDDTLYSEIDYLKSAFKSIAHEISPDTYIPLYNEMLHHYLSGGDTFRFIIEKYPDNNLTVEKLLYLYRNHYPEITLREGVLELVTEIRKRNGKTGIITDGRSITQRNKIKALGLAGYFDRTVISEEFGFQKPETPAFEYFMNEKGIMKYYYFGDNISKDFITPKRLGWICIGIIDKDNIHAAKISSAPKEFLPEFFINKFTEIEII